MRLDSVFKCATVMSSSAKARQVSFCSMKAKAAAQDRDFLLNILFSVEKQSKQSAEEMLSTLSGNFVNYVSFKLLRSEIEERLWKCLGEARSKHYNKLSSLRVSKRSELRVGGGEDG